MIFVSAKSIIHIITNSAQNHLTRGLKKTDDNLARPQTIIVHFSTRYYFSKI